MDLQALNKGDWTPGGTENGAVRMWTTGFGVIKGQNMSGGTC